MKIDNERARTALNHVFKQLSTGWRSVVVIIYLGLTLMLLGPLGFVFDFVGWILAAVFLGYVAIGAYRHYRSHAPPNPAEDA